MRTELRNWFARHDLAPATIVRQNRITLLAWLLIIPSLTILTLYRYIPLLWNFVISFQEVGLTGEMTFVGLENYQKLLTDPVFLKSLVNNIILLGTIPVGIAVALPLALLLNQEFPGSNVFRAIFFLPYIVMMVAVAIIWSFMFKSSNGVINHILLQFGLIDEGIFWTSSSPWALISVFIVHIWKTLGFYLIILLAGLQTIPREVYEVARIDGAGRFKRFRYITLPLLKPTIGVCVLVGMISSFRLFDLITVLTDGGPSHRTEILLTWLYEQAFSFNDIGYAAVLTIVLFLLMLSVIAIGRLLQRGVGS